MNGGYGDYDYDDHADEDEDDDDLYEDCGLGLDGQCLKAGSEECDWECPHSRGEFFAGSALWNKKHDEGAPVEGCECTECRNLRKHRPPTGGHDGK